MGKSLELPSQLAAYAAYALIVGIASLITACILLGQDHGARWALYAVGVTIFAIGAGCLGGNAYTTWYEAQSHNEHAHEGESAHAGESASAGGHADASHDEHAAEEAHDEHAPVTESTSPETIAPEATSPETGVSTTFNEPEPEFGGEGPKFPGVFFSIYYAMTGVHALHIMGGIGVFVWIVYRAAMRHFEPSYYGPVEYVGLYWHLVDLIWIFLFPLLYLI